LKNQYGANLGKPKSIKVADSRKQGFLGEIKNRNANFNDDQLKEIEKAYDNVYQKTGKVGEAMDAASAKTRQLGGTMMDSAQ
jgi:hypothetical protein